MKIKEDFVLRQIADTWAVLPLGSATLDFNGMMTVNETGALLWQKIEGGCTKEELISLLTSEYDVTNEEAEADVYDFIAKLKTVDCIEL